MTMGQRNPMELKIEGQHIKVDIIHRISRVLVDWLKNPRVAMEPGREMLMELKAAAELNVHVGISYATAALELGVGYQEPRKVGLNTL